VSTESQELLAFVRQLPVGPAYAPIYAKGQVFGKHQDVSSGKAPYEKAHHAKLSPSDVALLIEQRPEVFRAVGLFTGIRSDGLVILDVDANLAALRKRWGDTLQGAPVVESTKKNAAKFVFRVPEEQRSKVKGISGKVTGAGYEVLWGMQGVIGGEYPGSSDGSAPGGFYRVVSGSFDEIPVAPDWLLAEMRAAKEAEAPVGGGFVKNRKGLDFSGRTEDEVVELVRDCLAVLPHLGRGTEDFWWSVGAMVAEALPNEKGLVLWSAWSAEDPAFERDWESGNPCEAKWEHILGRVGRANNKGLGSLIFLADEYDPGRERFQESSRKTLGEVEAEKVQKIRQVHLDYEEVIQRAKELQNLDNPAEMAHRMNALALEAGYRDAGGLERLLISQMQYEQQEDEIPMESLLSKELNFEYLIPDLLPCPGTVMIHGAGGDGKSVSAWTLAKHVARGLPFQVRGDLVPVERGSVLILNGDQSEVQVQQQMRDLEFEPGDPVTVVMGWDLNWYYRFVKLIEKHRPKLVIIDSITGCSRGSAFDENKKEFAGPIYWLSNNNGRLFPGCTILLVHHANKTGGFRGSTAIRDAVDEVWSLRRPDKALLERVGANARLITVEKSRAGRDGSKLLMKLESDLTFSLADYVELDADSASPASVVDRVLQRLRSAHPRALTRSDLASDPLCGGSVAAIRKALQRLVSRGLVVAEEAPRSRASGSAPNKYLAVLSRDMCVYMCPSKEKPSQGLESTVGQGKGVSQSNGGSFVSPGTSDEVAGVKGWDKGDTPTARPTQKTSDAKGSGQMGQVLDISPRKMRTPEELKRLKDEAARRWD
jgi:hypothetical protein